MIWRVLLGAVLGVLMTGSLLVACGTEEPTQESGGGAVSAPAPSPEPPVVDPTAIGIPKLGAWSTLIPLGLTDADCPGEPPCLASPPVTAPMQAGWYAGADTEFPGDEYQPGEIGPAVIAGHVDGVVNGRKGQPGIFHDLHKLVPGDEIIVERNVADLPQPPLTFVVTAVQHHAKNKFPTAAVYGETEQPELRLITCTGSFTDGHYVDNLVVFAELRE